MPTGPVIYIVRAPIKAAPFSRPTHPTRNARLLSGQRTGSFRLRENAKERPAGHLAQSDGENAACRLCQERARLPPAWRDREAARETDSRRTVQLAVCARPPLATTALGRASPAPFSANPARRGAALRRGPTRPRPLAGARPRRGARSLEQRGVGYPACQRCPDSRIARIGSHPGRGRPTNCTVLRSALARAARSRGADERASDGRESNAALAAAFFLRFFPRRAYVDGSRGRIRSHAIFKARQDLKPGRRSIAVSRPVSRVAGSATNSLRLGPRSGRRLPRSRQPPGGGEGGGGESVTEGASPPRRGPSERTCAGRARRRDSFGFPRRLFLCVDRRPWRGRTWGALCILPASRAACVSLSLFWAVPFCPASSFSAVHLSRLAVFGGPLPFAL